MDRRACSTEFRTFSVDEWLDGKMDEVSCAIDAVNAVRPPFSEEYFG